MPTKLRLYIDLILHGATSELQARYAGSVLGLCWALINPLLQISIYTLVFAHVMRARLPADESGTFAYSVHLCSALLPWTLFAEVVQRCSTLFVDNGNLIKKAAFPRLSLPLTVLLSSLFQFAIIYAMFQSFLLIIGKFSLAALLWSLPLIGLFAATAVGLGLIFGTLHVYFRDVAHIQTSALQFWFWLTPIVWVIDAVPTEARRWLALNPMLPLVSGMQGLYSDASAPPGLTVLGAIPFAAGCMVGGLVVFRALASNLADEL